MSLSIEKAVGKFAIKDRQETFLFYDSPWSNSHKFPWDFPLETETSLNVITADSWREPELYIFLRNIGARVYTTPSLVHFKNGKVYAVANGCGQINTHLNIVLGENHGRASNEADVRNTSRRVSKGRKGSKGPNRKSRSPRGKEASRSPKEGR